MFILETVSYQVKFQKHIYLGWWNNSINRRTTYGYQTNFKQSVGMRAELSSTGTQENPQRNLEKNGYGYVLTRNSIRRMSSQFMQQLDNLKIRIWGHLGRKKYYINIKHADYTYMLTKDTKRNFRWFISSWIKLQKREF